MENNSESSNYNGGKILYEFDEVCDRLDGYIESLRTKDEYKVDGDRLNRSYFEVLRSVLNGKILKYKQYIQENLEIFKNNEFSEILLNDLKTLSGSMLDLSNRNDQEQQKYVLDITNRFIEKFENIKLSIISQKNANNFISDLKDQFEKAKKNVESIESAKLALESNETDKIFIALSDKYEEEYELNNEYFRNSLILTVCCTIFSVVYTFNTSINEINWPVFISIKILIVAVGITLCTLFLRRSAHAKKLHEKAYQTHVEINAYPIFIKSLETKDQQEITKELALRYFGNDIDQAQNDKIGDLMQDQLSAGTELIRASAEMVKAKQGNGENT